MTSARLQTIGEIFHAALDCKPEQLNAFLDETCAGDEVLHSKVEALLASHQQAGNFIDTPVAPLAKSIVENGRADLLIGRMIGHYKISKRIGTGGMGEVYLASDISAGRKAALKLLPTRFTGDSARLKRFQLEARAVAGLNHPNILTVYEVGADSTTRYIASELIEGETLRQRLARGSMQVGEAVEIAIQAAGALAAAHQAGVIHRDVKPENIMVRPDGYVKVLDFGIAKLAEQEVPVTMAEEEALLLVETNLGSVLGTVRYMSPEQARGAPVDRRTDIWSLGVVLYEMATGRTPFTGDTPREVMAAIVATEPQPLSRYMAQGPDELQQIVSKALRKDPGQRYQDASEMLEALKGLRHNLEFAAELKHAATVPFWIRWIRSPTALTLTLLAGALALAFPFYWLRNPTMKPTPEKSVAVLPFENLSEDKQNSYFADGVQDEILSDLAKIADLKVISRTSVTQYKSGVPRNLREIGQQLGVAHVVEGSVQWSGNRVRVNVQLIDTHTDQHLWGQTYDRELTEIFAVESDVAKMIAATLRARLTATEESAIVARPTQNSEAHDLYLRGRYFVGKRGDDFKRAIDYFNQAIAKDPNYAAAYAGLAECYVILPGPPHRLPIPPAELVSKARAAARKALALDNTLAQAHCSLGLLLVAYDGNVREARREFERAIALNPNYADAHYFLGYYVLKPLGDFDHAIAEFKRAIELDPFSVTINANFGMCYFIARRYPEAIAQAHKAAQMAPSSPVPYIALAAAHEFSGQRGWAIADWQKACEVVQQAHLARAWADDLCAQSYVLKGEQAKALQLLDEIIPLAQRGEFEAFRVARIYNRLGDKNKTIEWLERSYQNKEFVYLLDMNVLPAFDPLRGDPRFEKLADQVIPPDVRYSATLK